MRVEDVVTMEKIVSLCKRRGFVFPSSEIYGGVGSTYDYGHYGVLLKNNVKGEWWRSMLRERDDIVAMDSAILQHPRTWEASGHLANFTDPLIDCRTCKQRFRADHLDQLACGRKPSMHPGEFADCDLTQARDFNLMFETTVGPVKETGSTIYLRPETAQGIFVNFKTVAQFARKKPPFGIAQVGKSFRNEITPGNFIFRTREFEQMEMEFFVPPPQAAEWFEYWTAARRDWYLELGIRADHLRLRPHDPDELSHYSSRRATSSTCSRSAGQSSRGSPTAATSTCASTPSFPARRSSISTSSGERYVPHVIEPAAGADRATLAFLVDAYDEEEVEGDTRTLLRLHPRLAPVKVAILPLLRKDGQPELAPARSMRRCARSCSASTTRAARSAAATAARTRSARPWCVTIDHESVASATVTVRDRDSLAQERLRSTVSPPREACSPASTLPDCAGGSAAVSFHAFGEGATTRATSGGSPSVA
jgi:glycyl-tRNA synthetase